MLQITAFLTRSHSFLSTIEVRNEWLVGQHPCSKISPLALSAANISGSTSKESLFSFLTWMLKVEEKKRAGLRVKFAGTRLFVRASLCGKWSLMSHWMILASMVPTSRKSKRNHTWERRKLRRPTTVIWVSCSSQSATKRQFSTCKETIAFKSHWSRTLISSPILFSLPTRVSLTVRLSALCRATQDKH